MFRFKAKSFSSFVSYKNFLPSWSSKKTAKA